MSLNINLFDVREQLQKNQIKQHVLNKSSLNKTETDSARIYLHPTLAEYYLNLTPFIILSIFVACLIVVLNISIFCTTVSHLKQRVDAYYRGHSILLCSLYPIISCAALTTILFPKSWLVCHTVMHLSFTVGAVAFHQLCFRYVESKVNYLKETDGATMAINTPPCCCCCMCLPAMVPSKVKFCLLRYMVWQLPFVQTCIMLVINMTYFKDQDLYKNVSIYFIPFIASSILLGVWALNITVRLVNAIYSEYNLMKRLFCLQLIMLLCKVQYLLLDSQLNHFVFGDKYPINHTIYKQAIINLLILVEMVFVSLLVQSCYKAIPTTTNKNIAKISVISNDCDINYIFK